MNKKIRNSIIAVIIILVVAAAVMIKVRSKEGAGEEAKEISPSLGSIQRFISTTGTVLPKNRLEIKPPVPGRVESILVKEGENVKMGQLLAWMSSTERAALLDAAQGQGQEKVKYWQDAYKPIALLAPIDGEVIVATTQPGQTVTASDAVVVLSDHLIVRAQVDETDIGKIKPNQKALLSLDAYPDTKVKARVEHIYYESKTVNNVTIYEVDLIPEEVLKFFRSGMNATIDFIEESRENVLVIPLEAVLREKDDSYVLMRQEGSSQPVKRQVNLGLSDDKNVEVLSGVTAQEKILEQSKKFSIPKSGNSGSNPFMPFGKKKDQGKKEQEKK